MELLFTLVIIAILAAMLLPSLQTAREKARSAQCVANLRVIMVGISMYADSEAAFMPPSLDILANGVYMQESPHAFEEPKTGSNYVYQLPRRTCGSRTEHPLAWRIPVTFISVAATSS
jgi:type II secretory pathway pseudopilin PulG